MDITRFYCFNCGQKIPILFLLSVVLLHRNKHLEKYFLVFFAFFIASFVFALEHIVVGEIWPKYKVGILP